MLYHFFARRVNGSGLRDADEGRRVDGGDHGVTSTSAGNPQLNCGYLDVQRQTSQRVRRIARAVPLSRHGDGSFVHVDSWTLAPRCAKRAAFCSTDNTASGHRVGSVAA